MTTDQQPIDDRDETNRSRFFAVLTIGSTLALLWLPLLGTVFADRDTVSTTEKRFLASPPRLDATPGSWLAFPRSFESWYDDHAGFRNSLIRSYAVLTIELFGVSPTDTLLVGKQGWFFFGDPDAIAHYRGVAPLGDEALARWARVVRNRRDWLAKRDIAYLLVLVPDKHLVYGEFMPDSVPRTGDTHPYDQLARYLTSETDVPVLDLRPALLAKKRTTRVYHRTDSHWNDVGAHVASSAILDRLRNLVPALRDALPVAVEGGGHEAPGLGLASIVGLSSYYTEEVLEARKVAPRSQVKREHLASYAARERSLMPLAHGVDDPARPRAVMFRDSFGNALIPYVSEYFRRILYVWNRDIDPRVVEIEKPDVVIQEIVGRFLGRPPKKIEEVARAQSSPRR